MDPQLGVAPGRQPMPSRRPARLAARGIRRARRSASTQMVPSSLLIGWRPPARSTIDSRRAPIAKPGSRWICSSSGPRCAIAPVIASNRPAENSRRPVQIDRPSDTAHLEILSTKPIRTDSPPAAPVDPPADRVVRNTINYNIPRQPGTSRRTPHRATRLWFDRSNHCILRRMYGPSRRISGSP